MLVRSIYWLAILLTAVPLFAAALPCSGLSCCGGSAADVAVRPCCRLKLGRERNGGETPPAPRTPNPCPVVQAWSGAVAPSPAATLPPPELAGVYFEGAERVRLDTLLTVRRPATETAPPGPGRLLATVVLLI